MVTEQEARQTINDALMDSQYLAGMAAGWNAAQADDPEVAFAQLQKSRGRHLADFAEAKAFLANRPRSVEVPADLAGLRKRIAAAVCVATGDDIEDFGSYWTEAPCAEAADAILSLHELTLLRQRASQSGDALTGKAPS